MVNRIFDALTGAPGKILAVEVEEIERDKASPRAASLPQRPFEERREALL